MVRNIRGGGSNNAPSSSKTEKSSQTFVMDDKFSTIYKEIEDKGPGIIRTASSGSADYGRLRTGILSLDLALAGGFKKSRAVMLYGEKSTGKSTVAQLLCANAQREEPDKAVVWIDIEGTFDKTWAGRLGMDLDRTFVVEPETGEEAVDIADALMRQNQVSALITDSLAFLTPMKEIESSAETSLVGVHARLIGNYIRRINQGIITQRHLGHHPLILHINQFRMKIGVMFGDPRVLPGGKALEFSTSQQVQTYNKEHMAGSEVDYNEHEFKITKDKTGGRIKEGKFKLIRSEEHTGLPEGYVDQAKTTLQLGTKCKLVTGRYQVGDYCKVKSESEYTEWCLENPHDAALVRKDILDTFCREWGLI